ncbi:MAG: hypothetical protein SO401_07055 [Blautia sp.]|nr:hypothetical protein [Clostridia bacterium]MDY4693302.1 hypothetical protein [Blautia sp.]MDY5555677.1 hypothetical protein [Blautia sp.]
MKRKISELFKSHKVVSVISALTLVLVVGSVSTLQQGGQVSELPVYTDPEMETAIEEEETPLASKPEVKTKTSQTKSTKKVTMKKAATKSYTKKLPSTSQTSKKTSSTANATITTSTTVVKDVTEKYTKKSKVKLVTTVTTTKVTTTTVAKQEQGVEAAASADTGKSVSDISRLAPKEDADVLKAFKTLGFSVEIDPSVSYSGYFNARERMITLKKADDTIYHELGHFAAFVAGNVDKSSDFVSVYNQEKSLYTAFNKAYVTQNSQEYFAESAKEFVLNAAALKASRPKTYAFVKSSFEKITDQRIMTVQKLYSPIWK